MMMYKYCEADFPTLIHRRNLNMLNKLRECLWGVCSMLSNCTYVCWCCTTGSEKIMCVVACSGVFSVCLARKLSEISLCGGRYNVGAAWFLVFDQFFTWVILIVYRCYNPPSLSNGRLIPQPVHSLYSAWQLLVQHLVHRLVYNWYYYYYHYYYLQLGWILIITIMLNRLYRTHQRVYWLYNFEEKKSRYV